MKLDRTDRKILSILQENNKIPNIELASEVGLSPPACLKRVKHLRESGIIVRDVSLIDPVLAGNKLTMIVSVEMGRETGRIFISCFKGLYKRHLKSPSATRLPEAMISC
ncbi:Lrp/AsnC family transcriptional regulator [Endozoicomonas lisbonensis]|uniref:Lrp/AsnC family transcriptional regulator n=1 Tax=Endozoicomonas lisbonensis TaxID=3120522 RepID=UPI0033933336